MSLSNYKTVTANCQTHNAHLIAVSKTRSVEEIMALYDAGQRKFGENRVQELLGKKDDLPKDIQWHLIGHLQRNKVKSIINDVSCIHSVDSLRLLKEINKQALAADKKMSVLLQFHIAKEDSKFGLKQEDISELFDEDFQAKCPAIIFSGVMGMATFTDDKEIVQTEFKTLKGIFDELKANTFSQLDSFKEISMGMSGDYELALQEGSTIVRVGSLLFGG